MRTATTTNAGRWLKSVVVCALCASTAAVAVTRASGDEWHALPDNGIAVGEPKIFDNRTLAIMLDTLNASLQSVRAIDATKILAGLGLQQGSQTMDVSRAFSLLGAPRAGGSQSSDVQVTTGGSGSTNDQAQTTTSGTTSSSQQQTGTNASQVSDTKNSTTIPERDAARPTLPDLIAAPSFTPQFGESAADMLSDQVNLTYQIVNLQMLLDRALTDRIFKNGTRRQAVLGFNISLDPPHGAQDSAAVVEVTVRPHRHAKEPASLVAMMPFEKTYNSSTLSTKATEFGGSAVTSIMTLGYDQRQRSQVFYLFRDNDTLAFERSDEAAKSDTMFGWEFRPVLGRRSVAPGTRQLFAVLALPAGDGPDDMSDFPLEVSVRTSWRKYDRSTQTTATPSAAHWVTRVLSLGTAGPGTPRAVVDTSARHAVVNVPSTASYENTLQPTVDRIDWLDAADQSGVLAVTGRNFFQQTVVQIGGVQHDSSNGLTIKSDQAMDVVVPLSELVSTDGVVLGRYGHAVLLTPTATKAGRIAIHQATIDPPLGNRRKIEIHLRQAVEGGPLLGLADLPKIPAIITVDGVVVPKPYDRDVDVVNGKAVGVVLRAFPSVDQFKGIEGIVAVHFPFSGVGWTAASRVYDPEKVYAITRIAEFGSASDKTTKLLIATNDLGVPFGEKWVVSIDRDYPVVAPHPANPGTVRPATGTSKAMPPPAATIDDAILLSPHQITLNVKSDVLNEFNTILLKDDIGTVHVLPVPDGKPPKVTPKVKAGQAFSVHENDAVKIVVLGDHLDKIASVTADATTLEAHSEDGGLAVYLVRAVTAKSGTVALTLRDDQKDVIDVVNVTILPSDKTGAKP